MMVITGQQDSLSDLEIITPVRLASPIHDADCRGKFSCEFASTNIIIQTVMLGAATAIPQPVERLKEADSTGKPAIFPAGRGGDNSRSTTCRMSYGRRPRPPSGQCPLEMQCWLLRTVSWEWRPVRSYSPRLPHTLISPCQA